MSTANKLTYLNGTKQAIKQAINEDFEVIDNNTTFREYADEISSNNAKYKDLIPKETKNATNTLDISNSAGLDKALVTQYGNTYQETTTGKNKLNPNLKPNGDRGIIGTYNNSTGEITITGTPTAVFSNIGDRVDFATPLPAGTYTLSTEKVENVRIGLHLYKSGGDINNYAIALGKKELQITVTDEITGYYLYIYGLDSTKQYNQSFKAMFESGSSATDWEKYTGGNPAPNPDYPQEIVNISGKSTLKDVGKNFYNYDNNTDYSTYYLNNEGDWIDGGSNYINQKINITSNIISIYIGAKIGGAYIRLGQFKSDGTFITRTLINGSTNNITLNSDCSYIWLSTNKDSSTRFENVSVIYGNSISAYEPYQEQSFDLYLKSRNLFDKQTVKGSYDANATLMTIQLQPNTQYTFSRIVNTTFARDNGYYLYFVKNEDTSTKIFDLMHLSMTDPITSGTETITTGASGIIKLIGVYAYPERVQNYFNNVNVQIEEGSTATEYEPFYDINLCKIENYKDRIYPLNGKWYLEKRIGKKIYVATDFTIANNNNYSNVTYTQFDKQADNIQYGNYDYPTIAPYFDKAIDMGMGSPINGWNSYISDYLVYNSPMLINYWMSFAHNTPLSTIRKKLDGLIMYYVLATPTTEEITESNYPTLYNQLNNIKLYEGVNHITMTNESGLDVEFDIEYYKDWKLD